MSIVIILVVAWPNLQGRYGIGTETLLDLNDPLFGDPQVAPPRPTDDSSPVTVDWPRDRRLIERVRGGHFDLWNPVIGNGAPLAPDTAGIFSPLRLILYAAPVSPYTAFVLFRVFRLLVAALGAYLLARAYALSKPASVVVSISFGLSGGMISQLFFGTILSVCWLPWICWAQLRLAIRPTARAMVPLGLSVAATLTGGHQPIIAGTMLGALVHAVGVLAMRPARDTRRRTAAAYVAAGYAVGLLLAAPAWIATVELLAGNGYSYKANMISQLFQEGSVHVNRAFLFAAAFLPWTVDHLRDGVANVAYPYTLNFSAGLLVYAGAAVALARRRWRLDLALLLLAGVVLCFAPPGTKWLVEAPFIGDIQGRYLWALVMLPVCVQAGFGVDALIGIAPLGARAAAPGPLALRMRSRFLAAPTATLLTAAMVFAVAAAAAALLMRVEYAEAASGLWAALHTDALLRRQSIAPAAAMLAVLFMVGLSLRRRWRGVRWAIALLVCAEAAALAIPHLHEPASRQIRLPPFWQTAVLADQIEREHTRVGGVSGVTIGWRGWRETRAMTPIAPLRYARFLEAAAGPIQFTYFALPTDRSALLDLAAGGYLIVGRGQGEGATTLQGDPLVPRIADINGVSVFRNLGALPRARVVHATTVVPSLNDAVARLAAWTANADHVASTPLASVVILEAGRPGETPAALSGGPPTPATFLVDEPDEIVLAVDEREAGYLVLADTHYPGWQATVDGRAAAILPANVGFRAVAVPPGKHSVSFRFRPASFRWGVAGTMLGAVACAAALAAGALTQKRRRRRAAD